MAELTNLEDKIGEVLGLAQAAQKATQSVSKLCDDQELLAQLSQMHDEAAETETRATEVAGTFEGKKTAILEKARETKQEAVEMMETYLGEDADALDGFEFLTMAEAGEVGHWSVVEVMNQTAKHPAVGELTAWALPIQQKHFEAVKRGSLVLAADEDPAALA